ncbi:response regulator [Methanoregula sp.]|uniref:response regulator n=1 Tax=Methanoregula sp. TaxID=2052170 RepID=UPI003BB1DA1E
MKTILVVDDNLDVVEVFMDMLKEGGYHSLVAFSGEECLDILKKDTPDLIILDIMMEPMDGWETLEKIKSDVISVRIPVLMLTSKQVMPAEMKKYGNYIEDYVLKPVTNYELYDVIEHVFRRQQQIRSEVDRARQSGIDFGIITEYAQLSRSIDINNRFLHIFKTMNDLNNSFKDASENIAETLEKLGTTIKVQRIRLQQIQEEIKVA